VSVPIRGRVNRLSPLRNQCEFPLPLETNEDDKEGGKDDNKIHRLHGGSFAVDAILVVVVVVVVLMMMMMMLFVLLLLSLLLFRCCTCVVDVC